MLFTEFYDRETIQEKLLGQELYNTWETYEIY